MIAPIFAANWKMNNGPTTAREFMLSFCSQYPRQNDRTIIFFPPALSFHSVAAVLGERHDILLGVQNIYWEDQGAFTGELSVPIARDAGARLALVGHSERRHVFGETDEDDFDLAKKFPREFISLVLEAFERGEISNGRAAEMFELNRGAFDRFYRLLSHAKAPEEEGLENVVV
jgi:triosephosphate isomerase